MCALRGGDPRRRSKADQVRGRAPPDAAGRPRAARGSPDVVAKFDDPDTPYLLAGAADVRAPHYGDYDHLARVKEWSLTGGADEDESDGE